MVERRGDGSRRGEMNFGLLTDVAVNERLQGHASVDVLLHLDDFHFRLPVGQIVRPLQTTLEAGFGRVGDVYTTVGGKNAVQSHAVLRYRWRVEIAERGRGDGALVRAYERI